MGWASDVAVGGVNGGVGFLLWRVRGEEDRVGSWRWWSVEVFGVCEWSRDIGGLLRRCWWFLHRRGRWFRWRLWVLRRWFWFL